MARVKSKKEAGPLSFEELRMAAKDGDFVVWADTGERDAEDIERTIEKLVEESIQNMLRFIEDVVVFHTGTICGFEIGDSSVKDSEPFSLFVNLVENNGSNANLVPASIIVVGDDFEKAAQLFCGHMSKAMQEKGERLKRIGFSWGMSERRFRKIGVKGISRD